MPFLVCGQPKRFLPRSGVFFLSVCVDSPVARLFFVGCPAPPRGKGGPGGQRPPLGSEDPIFGKTLFIVAIRLKPFCLDMVMGIIDASLPPTALCMYLVYVRGLVRECSDRVDACACDLWADFLGAFVCDNKQLQTKRTTAPKLPCVWSVETRSV